MFTHCINVITRPVPISLHVSCYVTHIRSIEPPSSAGCVDVIYPAGWNIPPVYADRELIIKIFMQTLIYYVSFFFNLALATLDFALCPSRCCETEKKILDSWYFLRFYFSNSPARIIILVIFFRSYSHYCDEQVMKGILIISHDQFHIHVSWAVESKNDSNEYL